MKFEELETICPNSREMIMVLKTIREKLCNELTDGFLNSSHPENYMGVGKLLQFINDELIKRKVYM